MLQLFFVIVTLLYDSFVHGLDHRAKRRLLVLLNLFTLLDIAVLDFDDEWSFRLYRI